MDIAVTGATGFLGRYIVNHLTRGGHRCRCWHRPESDRGGFAQETLIDWIPGELNEVSSANALVDGVDAVVHSGLHHPGGGFRGGEGDLLEFVEKNVLGTIRLIEAARAAGVGRCVFISTCAVHEQILDDRPLDEAHPLWPTSHYGAHKAAIEKFVHSYGLGQGYCIASIRPTGIYGMARPVERTKWHELVQRVARGESVDSDRGGKEVHAADVARAVECVLNADASTVTGQAFNRYDKYIPHQMVAEISRNISGSDAKIVAHNRSPKHQIETGKLRMLGMKFGGRGLLEQTVREMLGQ